MKNCYDCNHCEVCKWIDEFKDKDICDFYENGTPLDKHDEELIKETVESIWGKPPYTELLDKIRAEIYCLHHHPKLDFIKNDDVVEMVLDIIDKYRKGR